MSGQMFDKIRYEGRDCVIARSPLLDFFKAHPEKNPRFTSTNSACMRGYVASWEVRDNNLYLLGMEMIRTTEASFDTIFPEATDRGVFADWVEGSLRCLYGKLLRYDYMAFKPIMEFEVTLSIGAGVVQNAEHKENTLN